MNEFVARWGAVQGKKVVLVTVGDDLGGVGLQLMSFRVEGRPCRWNLIRESVNLSRQNQESTD